MYERAGTEMTIHLIFIPVQPRTVSQPWKSGFCAQSKQNCRVIYLEGQTYFDSCSLV